MDNDEELAPMVDGLSGALCVLILITTVFMISATDTIMSGVTGHGFKFSDSKLEINNNRIIFNGGINLSHQDLYLIRNKLREMKSPSLNVYIPSNIRNYQHKMVFNVSDLHKKLNLDFHVSIRAGEPEPCENINSCIYWSDLN